MVTPKAVVAMAKAPIKAANMDGTAMGLLLVPALAISSVVPPSPSMRSIGDWLTVEIKAR